MYIGVDYYPEHWPKDQIESDIRMMSELGINVVRMAEFAWTIFEPMEGRFCTEFFDHVIEKLAEYDIKVVLGTPTATPPAWLFAKHPEIMQMDEFGRRRAFGSRRQYCYNSSVYREYAQIIAERLADRYGSNEQVIGWQIDNEFGHEGSDRCYCPECVAAFRIYLQKRFGSIENFNKAIGAVFWNHTYSDFNQIPLPNASIRPHNPGLELEYCRFMNQSILDFQWIQIKALKRWKGERQFITHNASGGTLEQLWSAFDLADDLDFLSYDNYPVWGGLPEPVAPEANALLLDVVRGANCGRRYWIMEQIIGAQGHDIIGWSPRPGQAKLWTVQALLHGASDILFFNWRACTTGIEQLCYGILDHDGVPRRRYREVQEIIAEKEKLKIISSADVPKAEVALLYNPDNMWAWKLQPHSSAFDFKKELLNFYRPLFENNVVTDIIDINDDFNRYKMLVMPMQMLVDKRLATELREFVEGGGVLITGYRAGVKDWQNRMHTATAPGFLSEMCGIEVEEVESLQKGQSVGVKSQLLSYKTEASVWCDILRPVTAKTLVTYCDCFYEGQAAVTVNAFADGLVYYIGTSLTNDLLTEIYQDAFNKADIKTIATPKGVETHLAGDMTVVINHNDCAKEWHWNNNDYVLEPYATRFLLSKESFTDKEEDK